ncbi:hypothetical protein IWX81_002727 [Salinibacterium sp. CAN_S4]|uniref:hypothetical protein n=1 Tax=Salinibacterium sp. CAN_S4 TaxID=2787727 RepID=UPI0018EFF583
MATLLLDPVPNQLDGEPSIVGAKATVLGATAQALRDAITELRQLASDDVTISDAVDEVRTKADETRTAISKVEDRYQGAADAMHSYTSSLSQAQDRANSARQRITDNNSQAAYWRRRLNSLTDQAHAGESSQELLDDITEAQSRVQDFATEFHSAMSQYHGAETDKSSAVETAISALHSAAQAADIDDGFWDRVGNALENAYEWAQENLAPLIETLRSILEVLKSIVDILALIVSVLSIFLPFLAPLAAALTLVSIALAAMILLSSLLLFALGKESLGRVLGDAIGLVTSVITSKMGGLNVFKPAAKLEGLTNVFTRSAWSSGTSTMKLSFAFSNAIMGKTETFAGAGLDVAAKLFDPAKTTVKLAGGALGGLAKGGLDINLDFFPEGAHGGSFGPLSGGWDLNSGELTSALAKPVANTLSGGSANPILAFSGGISSLVGAS